MISIQERLKLKIEPFESTAWQWACMLRCAIPGKVVSFNSVKQTCVVQPIIQELVLKPPPGVTDDTTQNIPTNETIAPIQDVPIIMMRAGGWSITFPIVVGTECLLIFADMCIDGWYETGKLSPQYDRRRHDLSDAFALFGPWSQPNVVSNYSTSTMQIRSDDHSVIIDLNLSGINIVAPTTFIKASGGTPLPLVNSNFYTWFITTFMPSVVYVASPPTPPANPETTVLKGQ